MRIVIAPDKFKGTLDADGVADAVAAGVRRVHPGAELLLRPLADGGDGAGDRGAGRQADRQQVAGHGQVRPHLHPRVRRPVPAAGPPPPPDRHPAGPQPGAPAPQG
ncbi:glycerate kinase, partial [Klenkia sp. PcliD-1-E]|uniref:glycerate kinase n=1 Tax=Klenkia sp. PcliD-1-E TaxID=2954492 RepID=UPI002097F48C